MSYCTIAEVEAEGTNGGRPFDSSTLPTIAHVNDFILRVAAYIDARLRTVGISTPVVKATSPITYEILRDLNIIGAAARVQRIVFRRAAQSKQSQANDLQKEFEERLAELVENPSMLSDVSITASAAPWSKVDDLWDIDDADDITDYTFRLEGDY